MSIDSTDSSAEFHSYSERTLAIIKPEAYDHAANIIKTIRENGFNILAKRHVKLTPEQAADLYKSHYGHNYFPHLVAHMSSGPIIALVLATRNCIQRWIKLMGPARVAEAQAYWPDSLRACYGHRTDHGDYFNGLHGSSSPAAALAEIHFFFPKMMVGPLLRNLEISNYIQRFITPTLLPGLTKLAHEKPEDPIIWLADYLHKNNPNEPQIDVKMDDDVIDKRCLTPKHSEDSFAIK